MGRMSELWLDREYARGFDDGPPYVKGSDTSKSAAIAIAGNTKSMHGRIIQYLSTCPDGATDEQIQIAVDMKPSTQRPRRVELVESGKVKDSGKRAKTISGRSAVLWVLT